VPARCEQRRRCGFNQLTPKAFCPNVPVRYPCTQEKESEDSGTPEQTTTYNSGKIYVPARPSAIVTVTKDNVKQALIDSGYYQASDFTGLQ
jgi:hypothetical protein